MFKSHKLIQIKKKPGFTLAEILVTLAIIGVVASLTILTLIHNNENQKTVAGVKKAYSEVSQAYTSFITDGVEMDTVFAGINQHIDIINQFCTKLNCIKNCGTDTGCFPDVTYKYLNGNNWQNVNTNTRGKAILSDGSLMFTYDNGVIGCITDMGDGILNNNCGIIHIDINGFKGPNQLGRDLFRFWVNRNGIVTAGSNNDVFNDCDPTDTSSAGYGYGCASKVITEGAINY